MVRKGQYAVTRQLTTVGNRSNVPTILLITGNFETKQLATAKATFM
jgi:hypothetical protein